MRKVIVVGSANVDYTVAVDRLPAAGETVLGREFYQSFGGKGANQAVAARKAGADVFFLTKLGNDANGKLLERHLTGLGIPGAGLLRDPSTPTGVALIVVDRSGMNQIAVAPGSNRMLTVEEVDRASTLVAGGRALLVQLELPLAAVAEALTLAKRHRLTTILNPAPAVPLSSDVLKLVDVLTPNEGEARALTGQDDPAEAAQILLARGARRVIITLGSRGAWLRDAKTDKAFPSFPVEAVDSTGAGDAFNGALACALAEGRPLEEAIVFANAAGALTATRRGAQDALPARREIDELCRTSIPGA
ncbi:MAG: ribokinase [Nitrospirota bacterium]